MVKGGSQRRRSRRFREGEKVLCFHGPLLYEAKCNKVQTKDKITRYFIHYSGWNKNWDEWVLENRILKYNEANLQKQVELQKSHGVIVGSRTDAPHSPLGTGETDALRRVVRLDAAVETEQQYLNRVEVRVKIPAELKPWLVSDWELITKHKKVYRIPARVTVEHLMDSYLKTRSGRGIPLTRENSALEVMAGIKEYFNVMLTTQLLYKAERQQHAQVVSQHSEVCMSQLYGPAHLLRLFVKLGGLLAYTTLDERNMQLLLLHIHDFLRYMHKHAVTLFSVNDYVASADEDTGAPC